MLRNRLITLSIALAIVTSFLLSAIYTSPAIAQSTQPNRPGIAPTPIYAPTSSNPTQWNPPPPQQLPNTIEKRYRHLDRVPRGEERDAVIDMLRLIEAGGPFRHRQDNTIFGNREHRLPNKPNAYYHEYTVDTPGASTRGTRRIIRGSKGETYYTRDHYRTFARLD